MAYFEINEMEIYSLNGCGQGYFILVFIFLFKSIFK